MSAAIKLGSLEKTVGSCLLRSGVYYEQSFSCRKNCTTQPFTFIGDSLFFYKRKTSIFLWCQIDFYIICNLFWSHYFLIRCQTNVLLYWLQVSLQPDCKNLDSGFPILMAADKPCPLLQPSLAVLT